MVSFKYCMYLFASINFIALSLLLLNKYIPSYIVFPITNEYKYTWIVNWEHSWVFCVSWDDLYRCWRFIIRLDDVHYVIRKKHQMQFPSGHFVSPNHVKWLGSIFNERQRDVLSLWYNIFKCLWVSWVSSVSILTAKRMHFRVPFCFLLRFALNVWGSGQHFIIFIILVIFADVRIKEFKWPLRSSTDQSVTAKCLISLRKKNTQYLKGQMRKEF